MGATALQSKVNRRAFLSLSGALLAGLAGCAGASGESTPTETAPATPTPEPTPTMRGPRQADALPPDPEPTDGYPPEFEMTPAPASVDPASFETIRVEGQQVPLAPVEVTYRWYARGEARFADARGLGQYQRAHVYGAVPSPAPDGGESDPVDDWPKGDRIVCYCGCPHHLSSIRAANLLSNGYEEVYVIDEGVGAWYQRGYPMAGSEIAARPGPWVIEGETDASFAGETAWARHPESDQQEATRIAEDGSYELELYFSGMDADSRIEVETPGYRVTRRLGDLTEGVVTGKKG